MCGRVEEISLNRKSFAESCKELSNEDEHDCREPPTAVGRRMKEKSSKHPGKSRQSKKVSKTRH